MYFSLKIWKVQFNYNQETEENIFKIKNHVKGAKHAQYSGLKGIHIGYFICWANFLI